MPKNYLYHFDFYNTVSLDYYFKKILININTNSISNYKSSFQLITDFFSLSLKKDYCSNEFIRSLKRYIYNIETIKISIDKLILKNDQYLTEFQKKHPKKAFLIKFIYDWDVLHLKEYINDISKIKSNWKDLYILIYHIYRPFLLVKLIDVSKKEKEMLDETLYYIEDYNRAFMVNCFNSLMKFAKQKKVYKDDVIAQIYDKLINSYDFVYKNIHQNFYPLILRYIGYEYIPYNQFNEKYNNYLINIFNLSDVLQNYYKSRFKRGVEVTNQIVLPKQKYPKSVQLAMDLMDDILMSHLFSNLEKYPDFLGMARKTKMKNADLYHGISKYDNANFGIYILLIFRSCIKMIKHFNIEKNDFYSTVKSIENELFELENFVEVQFMRLNEEITLIAKDRPDYHSLDSYKRLSDEINHYKKCIFYPFYNYEHLIANSLKEPNVTPLYELIRRLKILFDSFVEDFDRRSKSMEEIKKVFYNAYSDIYNIKDKYWKRILTKAFKSRRSSLVYLNLFYIIHRFLELVDYLFNDKNSILNNFPTSEFETVKMLKNNENTYTGSIITEENLSKANLIENNDFEFDDKLLYNLFENRYEKFNHGGFVQIYIKNLDTFYKLCGKDFYNDFLMFYPVFLKRNIRNKDKSFHLEGNRFLIYLNEITFDSIDIFLKRFIRLQDDVHDYIYEISSIKYNKYIDESMIFCYSCLLLQNSLEEDLETLSKIQYNILPHDGNLIGFFNHRINEIELRNIADYQSNV